MAEREGLKAVQMFEAIARGEIKALWVMATNPAVSLPRAAAVREALGKLELFVVSENVLSNDTVECGRACAAAGRGLGREGRHRHQFGAPHFAPARLPAAAGRGQARLVDRFGGGATHRLRRCVRLPLARPTSSASTRHCRRSRTTARAISTSAASPRSPMQTTTRSRRCNGRCAPARRRPSSASLLDGGFFTPDRKAPLHRARTAGVEGRRRRPTSRCVSTPAASATSGTP